MADKYDVACSVSFEDILSTGDDHVFVDFDFDCDQLDDDVFEPCEPSLVSGIRIDTANDEGVLGG